MATSSSPLSDTSSPLSSSSLSSSLVSFKSKITTKLDDTNFLLWKQQIIAAVRAYSLDEFLSGETSIP